MDNIYCTHGERKHRHESFAELSECITRYHAFAKPREVQLLVSLGMTADEARKVPAALVDIVTATLMENLDSLSRQTTQSVLPRGIPRGNTLCF